MKGHHFSSKRKSKAASWENSLGIFLLSLVGVGTQAYADVPTGVIGGTNFDSSTFGALVFYPSGNVSTISLPANGIINGVAINDLGTSLIGGQLASTSGYAAIVS